MAWFSSIWKPGFRPVWEYSTKGIIWRLFPSDAGFFVGEERELSEKTVSFFCLDIKSGKALWEGMRAREPWWITLDAIYRDVVLLHGYAEPDMPEPRKIFAHDLHDGRQLWSDETLRFLFGVSDSIYTVKEETLGPKFFRVGLRDGVIKEEVESDDVYRLKSTIHGSDVPAAMFPVPIVKFPPENEALEKILARKNFRPDRITGVEYLEHGSKTILGFYEKISKANTSAQLKHHLAFFGPDGREEVHEVIDTEVIAPVPDSFFRLSDMIYFIREKHTLTAIQ